MRIRGSEISELKVAREERSEKRERNRHYDDSDVSDDELATPHHMLDSIRTAVQMNHAVGTTGDPLIDLSKMLVRGLNKEILASKMDEIMAVGTKESFEDVFVLSFATRNIRGGKGERDLAKDMWLYLAFHHTDTFIKVLSLVPKYGCWDDLFTLAARDILPAVVIDAIVALTDRQLMLDYAAVIAGGKSVSLCAKWAPRESRHCELAKQIAWRCFPMHTQVSHRLKAYRQMISKINHHLKTVEIKMCAGNWEEIQPEKVPSRAMQKYTKAFMNEKCVREKGLPHEIRHPDDPVRMACREHFLDYFTYAVKGTGRIFPREIVQRASDMTDSHPKDDASNALRLQLDDPMYQEVRDIVGPCWKPLYTVT